MGLVIEPGGAQWSYSGFGAFRRALAAEEGVDLAQMVGFGGEREWRTSTDQNITPLAPLLNHSDCDGYLHYWECEEVLPRLELIIGRWEHMSYEPNRAHHIEQAQLLAEGMRHSLEHRCALVFS